jgi:hypothetical protein
MAKVSTAVSIDLETLNTVRLYVRQRGDLSRIFQEGLNLWLDRQKKPPSV